MLNNNIVNNILKVVNEKRLKNKPSCLIGMLNYHHFSDFLCVLLKAFAFI
jgi:hypothetical protein